MKPHLAVEALAARSEWDAVPFRWIADPVRDTNADGRATLLSLASEGHLYPRPDRSEGSQASSEATILRGPLVAPDDLVVNPMWLVGGGIAVSGIAGTVSPDYRVYRFDRDTMHPRYAHYLLRSEEYRDQYRLYTRADTTFDRRVSRSAFEAMPVLVPSLDVQQRVAEMLDAETARLNALITKNKLVVDALDRRLQALVDTAFAPYTKATAGLGYVAMVLTSGIDKHTVEGQRRVRLCNYTDVYYTREISDSTEFMVATCSESEYDRLRLIPGDVVITKDSETADDIAIPAIIRLDDPDLVLGYHNALLRVLDHRVTPDFLYWFLHTRLARDHFALKARGVTRVGLRVEDIAALRVPTPPPDTQEDTADRLRKAQEKTDRLKSSVQRQIDLLKTRRRSLITAAVTGQITV